MSAINIQGKGRDTRPPMAFLLPSSSLRLLPSSSFHQIPFLPHTFSPPPSKPKPILSPHPSSLSFSYPSSSNSSKPAAAAHTSFPYSQLHNRKQPKKEPSSVQEQGNRGSEEQQRDDDVIIGDCLVFEDGAFEEGIPFRPTIKRMSKSKANSAGAEPESLVPEKWKGALKEINLTKKEKRKIAHNLRFGSRMQARKKTNMPDMEEYLAYRDMKLSQLNPVVLDNPKRFPRDDVVPRGPEEGSGGRVAPRNPRLGVYGESLEVITDFLNSGDYVPGEMNDEKKPKGGRKLFTEEEKALLNKRIPNLAEATSRKWLPLHTLASSGEFYLLNLLLKHNVDLNAVDKDGLTATHKAILSKKQAITSYLLRNSANPFVRDMDGATLMHYAVHTASSQSIKLLLLYNVDINLADNDGWTPLHLAVQAQRMDIVRLLLIKGADTTLKNRDGLRPLDLCLYSGHNMRTYAIIKLLKEPPKPKSHV